MLTEETKKIIQDIFLPRARKARQEIDDNGKTVYHNSKSPIMFNNEKRHSDFYRIEAYIDSSLELASTVWRSYAEFCKPIGKWDISVFEKSNGMWLYGINAKLKQDTKQVVLKTYNKYFIQTYVHAEPPVFYEEFKYLQSLLYAPKEEKEVSSEHYPHTCRQCGSPAYICPVFNKVDCSNPNCK